MSMEVRKSLRTVPVLKRKLRALAEAHNLVREAESALYAEGFTLTWQDLLEFAYVEYCEQVQADLNWLEKTVEKLNAVEHINVVEPSRFNSMMVELRATIATRESALSDLGWTPQ